MGHAIPLETFNSSSTYEPLQPPAARGKTQFAKGFRAHFEVEIRPLNSIITLELVAPPGTLCRTYLPRTHDFCPADLHRLLSPGGFSAVPKTTTAEFETAKRGAALLRRAGGTPCASRPNATRERGGARL